MSSAFRTEVLRCCAAPKIVNFLKFQSGKPLRMLSVCLNPGDKVFLNAVLVSWIVFPATNYSPRSTEYVFPKLMHLGNLGFKGSRETLMQIC